MSRPVGVPRAALKVAHETGLMLAIVDAVALSKIEPHRIFYICMVRCPGCKRHAVGLKIMDDTNPIIKYRVATVMNGEVLSRNTRRH